MSRFLRETIKTRRISAWVGAGLLSGTTLLTAGCHIDMWAQPKVRPFYASDFFGDQQGSRPLVPGTVPQGAIKQDDPAYFEGRDPNAKRQDAAMPNGANQTTSVTGTRTSVDNGQATGMIRTIPVRAVNAFASPKEMLLRGKDRYNAFCTPCHGKSGDGNGFITQRGLGYWQKLPASYHTARLRRVEDGHIYNVIVNGHGVMYGYGARIQDVNDRWSVVAYVRALQLARQQSGGVGRDSFTAPLIRPGEAPENNQVSPGNTTRTRDAVENPSTQVPGATATPAPSTTRPSNSRRDSVPGSNPAPKPGAAASPNAPSAGEGTGSRTETGDATSGAPRNVTGGAGEANP
jgi:mono/diheme cytochrome c family protein